MLDDERGGAGAVDRSRPHVAVSDGIVALEAIQQRRIVEPLDLIINVSLFRNHGLLVRGQVEDHDSPRRRRGCRRVFLVRHVRPIRRHGRTFRALPHRGERSVRPITAHQPGASTGCRCGIEHVVVRREGDPHMLRSAFVTSCPSTESANSSMSSESEPSTVEIRVPVENPTVA